MKPSVVDRHRNKPRPDELKQSKLSAIVRDYIAFFDGDALAGKAALIQDIIEYSDEHSELNGYAGLLKAIQDHNGIIKA